MKKAIIIGTIVGALVSFVHYKSYEIKVETPVINQVEAENILHENILTETILTETILTEEVIEEK